MDDKKAMQEVPPGQGQTPIMYYPPEDEINLVDLWRVLVRRQWVLWVVLFLAVTASVAAALLLPKKYFYRANVEIGTVPVNGDLQLIEDPNTVLAKVKEGYIAKAVSDLFARQPEYEGLEIEARLPKGSQMLVIEGKGPKTDQSVYLGVIDEVLDLLFKDHQRMLDIARTELEARLQAEKSRVLQLEDQKTVLAAELERLDDLDALLKDEIQQLRERLEASRARYARIATVKDASAAMTMLLVDNQIQEDNQRLQALQERLLIGQKNRREELKKQIADTERSIQVQKLQVTQAETNLENMRMTRAIVPPMRSPAPVGISRKMIVALGLVLGLFVGVMAVFFAEFLSKAGEAEAAES
ncbi:MAG: hypothetical protein Kow0060_23410 [Methylohalobius crimeensis]